MTPERTADKLKLIRELFSSGLGADLLNLLTEQTSEEMAPDPDEKMLYYALGRFDLIKSWHKIVKLDDKTFNKLVKEGEVTND